MSWALLGKTYLGEKTFDLAEAFTDLWWLVGGEVVKREGEERFHYVNMYAQVSWKVGGGKKFSCCAKIREGTVRARL